MSLQRWRGLLREMSDGQMSRGGWKGLVMIDERMTEGTFLISVLPGWNRVLPGAFKSASYILWMVFWLYLNDNVFWVLRIPDQISLLFVSPSYQFRDWLLVMWPHGCACSVTHPKWGVSILCFAFKSQLQWNDNMDMFLYFLSLDGFLYF